MSCPASRFRLIPKGSGPRSSWIASLSHWSVGVSSISQTFARRKLAYAARSSGKDGFGSLIHSSWL